MADDKKCISVVVSVYNEELSLVFMTRQWVYWSIAHGIMNWFS